jgi:NNP family nitrate/nitrite transporter-like MFS transporter
MTGGVGGFYLAASLGYAQQFTGSSAFGFSVFAGMALIAFAGIISVRPRWRRESGALAGARV